MSNRDELTLEQLMETLSQEHTDQTVIELLRNYCLQSTSYDIQKKGMEFLYINGFYGELQQLIDKNNESMHCSNREWAAIYQIFIDRRLNRYTPQELFHRINQFSSDEPELVCLIEFARVTVFYQMNEFSNIGNFLAVQPKLFESIDDKLLISYFNIRLYQLLLTYYLTRNELIMARKYAYRILNHTTNTRTKVNTHIKLGVSYTFDTYQQGMFHLNEALKLSKKHNLTANIHLIEQRNIPFLSAHFNRVEGITSTDESEQAHIEIAKGNNAKALAILKKVSIDSPFKEYYMGLAKQDKNLLLQSYTNFIEKRSDYFFSRLPLNALKNFKH
ncbi:AimR family lysis-lysogeny pheromone receptor [Virgibacillus sp. C22-A2]|uniref:AimR family lysis-lysogeny pheromone receptor n=2 Tax=Virgibacillus tibetensis TaxID=3042313 RepID=A0ABU6KJD4_9BACI|nr:AimR family lysis-lysogeny pheromone receptor [Virgibacillus sp. C22-A2]